MTGPAGESGETGKATFFDTQYRAMGGKESEALDHPLYRFVLPFATPRVDVAAAMVRGLSFAHAVELGVGDGGFLQKTQTQFARYDGFDISEYQLHNVPKELRQQPNVKLHQADLEWALPMPNDVADLVVSLSTIEYLRTPEHLVKEAFRMLRPGGLFLLHTMNIAFLPRRMQLLLGGLPTFNSASGWQGGVLHNFTFPTLRSLLRAEGFAVEQERCAGLAPRLRLWWKNGLASDMLFLARKPA